MRYMAKIYLNGDKKYSFLKSYEDNAKYYNYHRSSGPAIELVTGTKFWFKDGDYHRLKGPAIEYPNGTKSYYIDGYRSFIS